MMGETHENLPFCHLGDGHHLTGFPPAYLFFPELLGDPQLLAADDEEPPTCLRGAFAPAAVMIKLSQSLKMAGPCHISSPSFYFNSLNLTNSINTKLNLIDYY